MSIEFFAPGGARALACMKLDYRGYVLSFSNVMMRQEAAVFHDGQFLFEFSPTVEGIAIAKRKIDAWKKREPT